jgi:type I restriction enzyme S subunit
MKSGWQTSTLGDVLAVLRNGVNCKQDKNGKGDRISRIESISEASFDLEKVGYAELTERDKKRYRLRPGDILFSHINSAVHVGKTAVFDSTEPVYHGVNLLLMRPKDVVTSAYLEHALKFLFQSGYWRGVCKQSVHQASVNQQDISRVEISYPKSLPEQQRIVGVLDEAFEGIATAKANAQKNLQNARALFESHLQTVFTHRGNGWVDKKLEEVCTFINGRAYKKDEMLSEGKYPLLRVGNFFTNKDWYYSDLELDADKYCDTGDLLYAWSASFGPRVWEGGKVIYHYHIWKVLPNPAVVDKRFLLHLLEWDVDQIKRAHGTGTTMMHVSKGSMESRAVPIPPLKEQSSIVALLDNLTKETERLASLYERKLAALEALKESLLHQAFTGQLSSGKS